MKKKRSAHEKNQPSAKKKGKPKIESELVCEFIESIESISDKLDDFKDIIDKSDLSFSNEMGSFTDKKLQDISFEQYFKEEDSEISSKSSRFVPFLQEEDKTEFDRTFNYTKEESGCQYRYKFTNSEFLAFIAGLDPIEYLIVSTLLAILISLNFNNEELIVLYQFTDTITDTLQILVQQELIQEKTKEEKEEKGKDEQLEEDFTYLNNEILQLQNRIKELESHLKSE